MIYDKFLLKYLFLNIQLLKIIFYPAFKYNRQDTFPFCHCVSDFSTLASKICSYCSRFRQNMGESRTVYDEVKVCSLIHEIELE